MLRVPAGQVLAYFGVYLVWLFLHPEGELTHWLTLVLLPLALLWWLGRRAEPGLKLGDLLRRVGLHWPRQGRGVVLAIVLMLLVQFVQLMNRHQRAELFDELTFSRAMWVMPAAFLLMLLTAAFTEEFFFRGILQRAVGQATGRWWVGLIVATLAFVVYHVPYAYLNPGWPSAGSLLDAIKLAFINGVMGGVVLGLVWKRAEGSLLPPILVHAAVDWIPAMRWLTDR